MKRYQAIYPWAIITAAVVLRCWNISALPAWYDESYTMLVARLPLARLLQAVAGDVHPPLYYLITAGLFNAIPQPGQLLSLRLFSVVCATAGLAVAWHIAGLLPVSRSARLVALCLLAFHPVAIYYAQEGRMYTWLMLLVLVQCWALLRQNWWALGVATLLAIYTHNYGLFYSVIIGMVGLFYHMLQARPVYRPGIDHELTGPLARLITSMGVPVLLFIPWLWVLAQQMGQLATKGYWLPAINAGSILLIVYRVFVGYPLIQAVSIMGLPFMVAGLVVCFAGTRRWVALWALVLGPIILALGVGIIWGKPVLLYRGLLPSLPMLAMLCGVALTQATSRPGQVGRWLLLVPLGVCLASQLATGYVLQSKTEVYWPPINVPVLVHIEDTSYITLSAMYPETEHYLLNAGCPEQPGGMSDKSRLALGYRIIAPQQLPEHYFIAAVVSTLSTSCHEDTWHQLTDGQPALVHHVSQFGEYGIWER